MIHPGKDKKQSKSDRLDRALARATDTGSSHYGLDEKDVDFCTKQIKQSKSSFVMRWGRLGIHRVLCGAGVCFVAYDSSIKSISFFIPKQRGHEIARGSRSSAWGKKRSGVLLLPPLRKKPPLRTGQIPLAIVDDDDSTLSAATIRKIKAGLKWRIKNFQNRIDAHMEDDPGANWPAIASLGAQVENLEKQLSELPSPAETKVEVEIEVLDEAYRRAVISELLTTQSSLELCSEHHLFQKATDLAGLKDALFCLTPDLCDQTNREALHNAAIQLASQIDQFQTTRSWLPGLHRVEDSRTSKAMRARLRTLYTIYTTVFGSGTFGSQNTTTIIGSPDVVTPAPDDEADVAATSELPGPGPLSGWPAVAARSQFLVNEIRGLHKKITGDGTQVDADLHYQRLLYKRELGALPDFGECVHLSSDEIDRLTLSQRIGSLEAFIDWYSTGAGMGSVGYSKRLGRYAEHLKRMLGVWDKLYARTKGEADDVAESEQVSGS